MIVSADNKYNGIKMEKKNPLTKFIKLFLLRHKSAIGETDMVYGTEEDRQLLENIKDAKSEWLNATISFEYAEETDVVDYYTYKIKACQLRYEFFLKKAKTRGLKVEPLSKEVY